VASTVTHKALVLHLDNTVGRRARHSDWQTYTSVSSRRWWSYEGDNHGERLTMLSILQPELYWQ